MVRGWNLEGVYTVQYRNVPMYSLHTIQDLIVFRTHTRSSQTSHEPGSRSDYLCAPSHQIARALRLYALTTLRVHAVPVLHTEGGRPSTKLAIEVVV